VDEGLSANMLKGLLLLGTRLTLIRVRFECERLIRNPFSCRFALTYCKCNELRSSRANPYFGFIINKGR